MARALGTWQAGAGLSLLWNVGVTDWSECIVAIAGQRDRQRFSELFAHFAPRLKSFFARLGVSPALAEDLAQETMLMVWRKAATLSAVRAYETEKGF